MKNESTDKNMIYMIHTFVTIIYFVNDSKTFDIKYEFRNLQILRILANLTLAQRLKIRKKT